MKFKIPPFAADLQERADGLNAHWDASISDAANADTAKASEIKKLSEIKAELETKLPGMEADAILSEDSATLFHATKGRLDAISNRLGSLQAESRKSVMLDGAHDIIGEVFRHYHKHLPDALHAFLAQVEPAENMRSGMILMTSAMRSLGLVRDQWMYGTMAATDGNRRVFNAIVRRAIAGQACLLADCPLKIETETATESQPS